jgi:ribonuclease P protein component
MFNKKNRIPKESLKDLMSQKNYISCGFFVLKSKENGFDYPRFAIIISKKVSKLSVKRHLIKRVFAHFVLKYLKSLKHADYLFILSPEAIKIDKKELEKSVDQTLSKIN